MARGVAAGSEVRGRAVVGGLGVMARAEVVGQAARVKVEAAGSAGRERAEAAGCETTKTAAAARAARVLVAGAWEEQAREALGQAAAMSAPGAEAKPAAGRVAAELLRPAEVRRAAAKPAAPVRQGLPMVAAALTAMAQGPASAVMWGPCAALRSASWLALQYCEPLRKQHLHSELVHVPT